MSASPPGSTITTTGWWLAGLGGALIGAVWNLWSAPPSSGVRDDACFLAADDLGSSRHCAFVYHRYFTAPSRAPGVRPNRSSGNIPKRIEEVEELDAGGELKRYSRTLHFHDICTFPKATKRIEPDVGASNAYFR